MVLFEDGPGDVVVIIGVCGIPLALLKRLAILDLVDNFELLFLLGAGSLALFTLSRAAS